MNPEILLPKSSFRCTSISADKTGVIKWSTTDEAGSLDFIIEQYRWNRWVEVGQVKGKGTKQSNSYYFQITPHSGKNQLRVSQIDNTGEKRSSQSVFFNSGLSSLKCPLRRSAIICILKLVERQLKQSMKFTMPMEIY